MWRSMHPGRKIRCWLVLPVSWSHKWCKLVFCVCLVTTSPGYSYLFHCLVTRLTVWVCFSFLPNGFFISVHTFICSWTPSLSQSAPSAKDTPPFSNKLSFPVQPLCQVALFTRGFLSNTHPKSKASRNPGQTNRKHYGYLRFITSGFPPQSTPHLVFSCTLATIIPSKRNPRKMTFWNRKIKFQMPTLRFLYWAEKGYFLLLCQLFC